MSLQAVVTTTDVDQSREMRGLLDEIAMLEIEVKRQQTVAEAARKYSIDLATLLATAQDQITTLQHRLLLAEERLRARDDELQATKLAYAAYERETATSLATKAVASWRKLKDVYAPPQTRRRQVYDCVLILLKPIPQNQGS